LAKLSFSKNQAAALDESMSTMDESTELINIR